MITPPEPPTAFRGSILHFLADPGDGAVESCLEFFEDGSPDRSFTEGKGLQEVPYRESESGLRILTQPIFESLLPGSYIPTAANLWRTNTAKEIGGFLPRAGTCDDAIFFMGLSRMGGVAYYPYPIARKRAHEGNLANPRNALRLSWNGYEIVQIILDDADRWKLTASEEAAAAKRLVSLQVDILYHASKNGWQSYRENWSRLGSTANLQPAHPLRALLSSARARFSRQSS